MFFGTIKAVEPDSNRSFKPIRDSDLRRLAELATDELENFFLKYPKNGKLYRDRLLLLCLCQGAAEHFVRKKHGVKDFDVWAFYRKNCAQPNFFNRRARVKDSHLSQFGIHSFDEARNYEARHIDIFYRSIACDNSQTAQDAIRQWIQEGKKCSSAWHIAKRPVVVISPGEEFKKIIWDPANSGNS